MITVTGALRREGEVIIRSSHSAQEEGEEEKRRRRRRRTSETPEQRQVSRERGGEREEKKGETGGRKKSKDGSKEKVSDTSSAAGEPAGEERHSSPASPSTRQSSPSSPSSLGLSPGGEPRRGRRRSEAANIQRGSRTHLPGCQEVRRKSQNSGRGGTELWRLRAEGHHAPLERCDATGECFGETDG